MVSIFINENHTAAKKKCIYQRIGNALYTIVFDYRNRESIQYLSDFNLLIKYK